MAFSLSNTKPQLLHVHSFPNPYSFRSFPLTLSPPFYKKPSFPHSGLSSLKASASDADNLVKKPLIPPGKGIVKEQSYRYQEEEEEDGTEEEEEEEEEEDDRFVDWEDQILEDTVPLVGFVRMVLHSGQYENGDRLSPEHEKTILEKLLPFHPEFEKKIGCGINYITIGYHPNFDRSRCMFIVR